MVVPITKLRSDDPNLEFPKYMTPGSAGMDIAANIASTEVLEPFGRALIATGLAIALPENYEAQIRPRSGLALRNGLTVLNSPGTIDSDYRDEIKVLLINLGNEEFQIHNGDRIAQMVICPVTRVSWEEVRSLDSTERGGGFGHTGRRGTGPPR